MPQFQLLICEANQEPRAVPLDQPIIVGRSRNVDLTVNDEEVGRKQFRIGVNQGFVVLEGLGTTNPTRVDSRLIKAGESTTLDLGQKITVGKSEFVLQAAGTTTHQEPALPDTMDATMVAGNPAPPPAGDQTGNMNTMDHRPPGVGGPAPQASSNPTTPPPSPAAAGSDDGGDIPLNTMEFRPPGVGGPAPQAGSGPQASGSPAAPPPSPPAADTGDDGGDVPLNTMEFRPPGVGGPAPQAGNAPANPAATPASTGPSQPSKGKAGPPTDGFNVSDLGQTMAKGFRPGAIPPADAPATPATPSPPPPAAQPAAPTPATPTPPAEPPAEASPPAQPASPQPAPPQPAPPQPAPGQPGKAKPTTVAMSRDDVPPLAGDSTDLESLLHRSMPRLFVKGEGLKRPVRLIRPVNEVGRAEAANVLLPHESVSEQHAQISFDGKQWTLLDHGSTNGTIVDGTLLRSNRAEIHRNSLIGIGALHMIFLCSNPERAAADRREEERALQILGSTGRLDKNTVNEIRQMVRNEDSQSIAEVVLRDTPLPAKEWASAISTARSKVSLLDRILRLFGLRKK